MLLCLAGSAVTASAADDAIADRYPGYRLAFSDEFDKGTRPDPAIWDYELGMKRNNEAQCYTEDNATIADGLLVIEARKERVKNASYVRYSSKWNEKNQYGDYSSASIIAKDPNRFHYGVYEVRAKIPVGTGYWPAIWSCGSKYEWPYNGEIDMMEYYGDAIHANVAWGGTQRWAATWSSSAPRMSTFEADFADKFHIWRMEWDEEAIRIFLDDRLLNETMLDRTVNPNPGQDWYNVDGYNPYRDEENLHGMWLNLALGGNNGGSLDNTAFPARYYVDYVRVYVPDGIYSGLRWQLAKAQEALDSTKEGDAPGQYSADARAALRKAMTDAEALIDVADEAAAKAGADALKDAIKTYKAACNPVMAGIYRFEHKATGLMLSTGWKDGNNCVLLLDDNRNEGADSKDYNQVFTLEKAPQGAAVDGFNMKVGDGEYVYRDSWNLFVTSTPALTDKNYIFNVEFDGDYVHIKNEGSGKYFGNDDNWAWSAVYSDKNGTGNEKSYFRLINADPAAVADVTVDNSADAPTAVYNLQGIRVADTIGRLEDCGASGVYIVVSGTQSRKVIVR